MSRNILPLVLQSFLCMDMYKLIMTLLLQKSKHRHGKYLFSFCGPLKARGPQFVYSLSGWSVSWGSDYGDENLSLDICGNCLPICASRFLLNNCTLFCKCAAITSRPWNATVDSFCGTEFGKAGNSYVRWFCFSQTKQRFIWVRERNTWCNCEVSQKVSCLVWIGM
jgi:hypothetical protein